MKSLSIFKSRRPTVVASMVFEKLFRPVLPGFASISILFKDKQGIEIGGPSKFFGNKGYMPVYSLAKTIDGCNFSTQTAWEGTIKEGNTYTYSAGKVGHQFICEGANVENIPKHSYDFVLSCNNLEHIANPLKAVRNWIQLLKNEGAIVLVLPRKESNFDHRRQVTSFSHLLDDYKNNIGENDLTHLDEIMELHDLSLDPLAGSPENFKQRSVDNFANRCLHHHVFDLALLQEICNYFNLRISVTTSLTADHLIVATKS